jgi:surface protein
MVIILLLSLIILQTYAGEVEYDDKYSLQDGKLCYYKVGTTSTYSYPTNTGAPGGTTYRQQQTVESCAILCEKAYPGSTQFFLRQFSNTDGCACCDPTKDILISTAALPDYRLYTRKISHLKKTAKYKKIFDGEMAGNEIRMFEGNGDNSGDDYIEQCAKACLENSLTYERNLGTTGADYWVTTFGQLNGFIIDTTGRCYCEDKATGSFPWEETLTAPDHPGTTYDRYDFINVLHDDNIQDAMDWWHTTATDQQKQDTFGTTTLNEIDVSRVTDMTSLFKGKSNFVGDISEWDVHRVTNMYMMFENANGDVLKQDFQGISKWDTFSLTNMREMFYRQTKFNGDLSSWYTSKVTNMALAFWNCQNFNQNINTKTVTVYRIKSFGKCTDAEGWEMIDNVQDCQSAVDAIGHRATNNVDTPGSPNTVKDDGNNPSYPPGCFRYTWNAFDYFKFNHALNNGQNCNNNYGDYCICKSTRIAWDTSKVTNPGQMFYAAHAFNGDISNWNMGQVTTPQYMFYDARNFNGDISKWDMGKTTTMSHMFYNAGKFNADISDWDVSQVKYMNGMFNQARKFNQPIGKWDVSQVINMHWMFNVATDFNQNLNTWSFGDGDTGRTFNLMFAGASSLDQELCGEGWVKASKWIRDDTAAFRGTPARFCPCIQECDDGKCECRTPMDIPTSVSVKTSDNGYEVVTTEDKTEGPYVLTTQYKTKSSGKCTDDEGWGWIDDDATCLEAMLALKRTATTLSTSGWSTLAPHGCFEHTNKQIYNNPNAISISADCGILGVCLCKTTTSQKTPTKPTHYKLDIGRLIFDQRAGKDPLIQPESIYKIKTSGECTDDDGWGYIITPEECGIAASALHYSNNPGEDFPKQQANSATYPDYCWLYVQSSTPIIPAGHIPVKFNTVPSTGNCGSNGNGVCICKRAKYKMKSSGKCTDDEGWGWIDDDATCLEAMLALKRTATTLSTSGWSNDVPHGCFEHTNNQIYINPNAISVSADCGNYNWECLCKYEEPAYDYEVCQDCNTFETCVTFSGTDATGKKIQWLAPETYQLVNTDITRGDSHSYLVGDEMSTSIRLDILGKYEVRTKGLTNWNAITDWDECKREAKIQWPDAEVATVKNAGDINPFGCYYESGKIYFNDVAKSNQQNGACSTSQQCFSKVGGENQVNWRLYHNSYKHVPYAQSVNDLQRQWPNSIRCDFDHAFDINHVSVRRIKKITTTPTEQQYKLKTSGKCTDDEGWGYIEDSQECWNAHADLLNSGANLVKIPDIQTQIYKSQQGVGTQPACFLDGGDKLYLNTRMGTSSDPIVNVDCAGDGPGTSGRCICKRTKFKIRTSGKCTDEEGWGKIVDKETCKIALGETGFGWSSGTYMSLSTSNYDHISFGCTGWNNARTWNKDTTNPDCDGTYKCVCTRVEKFKQKTSGKCTDDKGWGWIDTIETCGEAVTALMPQSPTHAIASGNYGFAIGCISYNSGTASYFNVLDRKYDCKQYAGKCLCMRTKYVPEAGKKWNDIAQKNLKHVMLPDPLGKIEFAIGVSNSAKVVGRTWVSNDISMYEEYKIKRSGKCSDDEGWEMIDNIEDCQSGVDAIGLQATNHLDAGVVDLNTVDNTGINPSYSPGCFRYSHDENTYDFFRFNPSLGNGQNCNTDWSDYCICKRKESTYKIIKSGYCTDNPDWDVLVDREECVWAAKDLDIHSSLPAEVSNTAWAHGCVQRYDTSKLKLMTWFNNADTKHQCDGNHHCVCKRKNPKYKIRRSGKCTDDENYGYVFSLDECKRALNYFEDDNGSVDNVNRPTAPPGCKTFSGYVQFNELITSSVDCSGSYDCICKRIPYKIKSSGKCTDDEGYGYITTAEECEQYQKMLFPTKTFTNDANHASQFPSGCWETTNKVYMNNVISTSACQSGRKCICKRKNGKYKLKTSGKCTDDQGWEYMWSNEECNLARQYLDLEDPTPVHWNGDYTDRPSGCVYSFSVKNHGVSNGLKDIPCGRAYWNCICKRKPNIGFRPDPYRPVRDLAVTTHACDSWGCVKPFHICAAGQMQSPLGECYTPILDEIYTLKDWGKCSDDEGWGDPATKKDCEAAYVAMGFTGTPTAGAGWGWPRCILDVNDWLGWNPGETVNCSPGLRCICIRNPYKTKTSGKCTDDEGWGYITDVKECEPAADYVNFNAVTLPSTPGYTSFTSLWPYGCWFGGNSLYFRGGDSANTEDCNSGRRCLCKRTTKYVTDPSQVQQGARKLFAPADYKNTHAIAMFQGVECSKKLGKSTNSAQCRCGSVTCSAGQYCLKEYSICGDEEIKYVATTTVSSGLCEGVLEDPISTKSDCDIASQKLDLHNQDAEEQESTDDPAMCYYRDHATHTDGEAGLWYNTGDGLDFLVREDDMLICHYDKNTCICDNGQVGGACTSEGAQACLSCNDGYELKSNSACGQCPAGKFDNGNSCQVCQAGKWQNVVGQTSCQACGAGAYQDATGQTSCKTCGAGKYSQSTGSASCLNCPTGKAVGGGQLLTCSNCAAGKYQDQTGQGACKACPQGQFNGNNAGNGYTACFSCLAGKYADVTGLIWCKNCINEKYQDQTGQSACKTCPAGSIVDTTVNGKTCSACPIGKAQSLSGKTSCNICSPGHYQDSTGQTGCKQCDAGKYQTNSGHSVCAECPKGQYQNAMKQTGCAGCTAGKYQNENGNIGCKQCGAGKYSAIGQDSCANCDLGQYQNQVEQTACKDCPKGYYQNNPGKISCGECGVGKYQNQVKQLGCWPCLAGKFTNTPLQEECKLCPKGQYQDGSSKTECKYCQGGKFQSNTGQSACVNCLRGKYFTPYISITEGTCASHGYERVASREECAEAHFSVESPPSMLTQYGNTGYGACYKYPTVQQIYYNGIEESDCKDIGTATCYCKIVSSSSTDCKNCPLGFAQNIAGQSSCTECGAGTFSNVNAGAYSCSGCAAGKYQSEKGQTSCKNCATGKFTSITNQAECTGCIAGESYQNNLGSNVCKPCATQCGNIGQRITQQCVATSNIVCTNNECTCANGNAHTGAACTQHNAHICGSCYGGFRFNTDHSNVAHQQECVACTTCSAGKIKTNTCTSNENTVCYTCKAGRYATGTVCSKCAPGKFADVDGLPQCKVCQAGQAQGAEGQVTCNSCSIGFKQVGNTCQECQAGKYQPTTGQTECLECPAGKYSAAGKGICTACPEGRAGGGSNAGGGFNACTKCNSGTYQPTAGQSECLECPAGQLNQANGNMAFTSCAKCGSGRYQSQTGQTSCPTCPTNTYADVQGSPQCKTCGECPPGQRRDNCQGASAGQCVNDLCTAAHINCNGNGSPSGLLPVENCKCECNTGFGGNNCETAKACTLNGADDSTKIECDNGGLPTGTGSTCSCACRDGFTGTLCEKCASGFGYNPNNKKCEACTKPTANNDVSDTAECAQEECPTNFGVTAEHSRVWGSALWGHGKVWKPEGGNCIACPIGQFSLANNGQCKDIDECEPNANQKCTVSGVFNADYCENGMNTYHCKCPGGYAGFNSCVACATGKYSTDEEGGHGQCSSCDQFGEPGKKYYQDQTGQKICQLCDVCPVGQTRTSCDPQTGTIECSNCAADQFTVNGQCTDCNLNCPIGKRLEVPDNVCTCIDIDECQGQDCSGHGNCHDSTDTNMGIALGQYQCTCLPGYKGKNCDGEKTCQEGSMHNNNPVPIGANGGQCENGATATGNVPDDNCVCVCQTGFKGVNCEIDINECADETDNCHTHATCTNTFGGFACACKSGFKGNGVTCEDIDECADETDNCSGDAICANTVGSFECACKPGFEGNGVTCEDIDECAGVVCGGTSTCVNGLNKYTCNCAAGWQGGGDRATCTDIDECQSVVCGGTSTCVNGLDKYTCNCAPGWQGGGDKATCTDIDECDGVVCGGTSTCVNGLNKYTCNCAPGWQGGGDGATCTDIDECQSVMCGGTSTCVNGLNKYTCNCAAGWKDGGDNAICTDIDECDGVVCGGTSTCVNGLNKYTCNCAAGWRGGGDGATCADIDECDGVTCGGTSTCVNGLNKYTCNCAAGWRGGGVNNVCTDIDECDANTDECDQGSCQNEPGSYKCNCNLGWFGSKCDSEKDYCVGQTCSGHGACDSDFTAETYKCNCVAGFEGTDCETDIDECANNPCKNSAQCTDGIAKYTCECKGRWKGATCEDPWTCACPHGQLGDCLEGEDGSEDCSACSDGYYLKNRKCLLKGVCPEYEHDAAIEGETNCQTNVCTCTDGDAQDPCSIHQDEYCVACQKGFHLKIGDDKICEQNICKCDHGKARSGKACLEHLANECHSCDATYHVDSLLACSPNVCSCQNGTVVAECLSHNQEKCSKCDRGFNLEDGVCNPIENKRGDITYAITIKNTSLTNVEIEIAQETKTGFRHVVISRVSKAAPVQLASSRLGGIKLKAIGPEEIVTLEAFDNVTKPQGVYFTLMDQVNQEEIDLPVEYADVITITVVDEESPLSVTFVIFISTFIAICMAISCICCYHHIVKSPTQIIQYSVVNDKMNVEEGKALLQNIELKF